MKKDSLKNIKNRRNNELNIDLNKKYGNNKFICHNKIILGGKYYHMIISLILITFPTILFISIMFKINNYSTIVLAIITILIYIPIIYCLFMGGCLEPGLVKRNNEYAFYDNRKSVIKMNIKGHMLSLNYCYTCFHFRPPRTSHCAECDNCVENFDHHCLWLGTCVGKRNYKYFYYLISSITILSLISLASCIYYIINYLKIYLNKEKNKELLIIIVSLCIVGFISLMFLIFFLIKLFFLHSYLVITGLTFYEYIKKKYFVTLDIKPYSKGCLRNIINKLFKRVPSSKLNFEEIPIKKNDDIQSVDNKEKKSNTNENENDNKEIENENENNNNKNNNNSNNNNDNNNNNNNNINNANTNKNNNEINNNEATATIEFQNSNKENNLINIDNMDNNKNNNNNNEIKNNENNENNENNYESKKKSESNEVNFEKSINASKNNNNSIVGFNQKTKSHHTETLKSQEKMEFNNLNESNISKTRDNIDVDPKKYNDYYNQISDNYNPKPIKLKIKRYDNCKQISSDSISSNNVYLDYDKNKDVKIVKDRIFDFEKSSDEQSNQSDEYKLKHKLKNHND